VRLAVTDVIPAPSPLSIIDARHANKPLPGR